MKTLIMIFYDSEEDSTKNSDIYKFGCGGDIENIVSAVEDHPQVSTSEHLISTCDIDK